MKGTSGDGAIHRWETVSGQMLNDVERQRPLTVPSFAEVLPKFENKYQVLEDSHHVTKVLQKMELSVDYKSHDLFRYSSIPSIRGYFVHDVIRFAGKPI